MNRFEIGKIYRLYDAGTDRHSLVKIVSRTAKTVVVEFWWWWETSMLGSYTPMTARVKIRSYDDAGESEYLGIRWRGYEYMECDARDIEETEAKNDDKQSA